MYASKMNIKIMLFLKFCKLHKLHNISRMYGSTVRKNNETFPYLYEKTSEEEKNGFFYTQNVQFLYEIKSKIIKKIFLAEFLLLLLLLSSA